VPIKDAEIRIHPRVIRREQHALELFAPQIRGLFQSV
jgi:hypothetical protein